MREGLALPVVGCVDLNPQREGSAVKHFLEVLADRWWKLRIVPEVSIVGENLLDSRFFGLLARKWESVRFTRLSEKRRIRFSWRPSVAL
jgi:hypothetical protein